MKRAIYSAIWLAIWIGRASGAPAHEPSSVNGPGGLGSTLVCPDALLRRCCDIYCPKPSPCIPCFRPGCGVCYCSKPCPCITRYCPSCTDYCYCRKPCPDLCRPLDAHFFTCVKKYPACADSDAFVGNNIVPVPALQAVQADYTGSDAGSPALLPFLSD
jgi:hypothetical protein